MSKVKTCFECRELFSLALLEKFHGVFVCETCKPLTKQRILDHGSVYAPLKPAGFLIRGLAFLLDLSILFIVLVVAAELIFVLIGPFLFPLTIKTGERKNILEGIVIFGILSFVSFFYFVYFIGKEGATPGKRVAKIKVVRNDESPVDHYTAAARYFAQFLSANLLGVGYLMILLDSKDRKSLHDIICGTRVVYEDPSKNPKQNIAQ